MIGAALTTVRLESIRGGYLPILLSLQVDDLTAISLYTSTSLLLFYDNRLASQRYYDSGGILSGNDDYIAMTQHKESRAGSVCPTGPAIDPEHGWIQGAIDSGGS